MVVFGEELGFHVFLTFCCFLCFFRWFRFGESGGNGCRYSSLEGGTWPVLEGGEPSTRGKVTAATGFCPGKIPWRMDHEDSERRVLVKSQHDMIYLRKDGQHYMYSIVNRLPRHMG